MYKQIFKPSLALLCLSVPLHAQGDLTPPGAPGPTMKTLDQIEPRSDVLRLPGDATAMHIISQAGSYYLSGNLTADENKSGIRIMCDDVTLDLSGFRIEGTGADSESSGVEAGTDVHRVIIHSGIINYFGKLIGGRSEQSSSFADSRVSSISGFGPSNFGIMVPGGTNVVERCIVDGGNIAIWAGEVHRCIARNGNGQAGILAGDVSYSEGSGYAGIAASGNVSFCRGYGEIQGIIGKNVTHSVGTGLIGISASGNVSFCEGEGESYGISGSDVTNSTGTGDSTAGISASGSVMGSTGTVISGIQGGSSAGIAASGNVSDSRGIFSLGGNEGGRTCAGISAGGNVSNSIGSGAGEFGIAAGGNVSNSVGTSYSVVDLDNLEIEFSSIGIEGKTVDKSRGVAVGGTGIKCDIAIGCTVVGAEIIGNKYLMP